MDQPGKDSTHLYVKDGVQLFVDNTMIEAAMDLTRRWYKPVKDKSPIIFKDQPWEHIPYFTYSNYCVLRDPEAHAFYGLGRAVLRKEGFASLQANRIREGILVTRALISKGAELIVNARCAPGGSLVAEVTDGAGNVIPGFEKQSCDTFTGDSVAHRFTWKGESRIPKEG